MAKQDFIDEFPDLIGEHWERRMDALGHNVTLHLYEQGVCPRCEQIKSSPERREILPIDCPIIKLYA